MKPGRDELWARLEALPGNVKGEIIDGELYTQPRALPSRAGHRLPRTPPRGWVRLRRDWVCEMLSPSNARYDLLIKFPFYARVGVSWLWRVDTRDQTFQVMELVQGAWVIRATCSDEKAVRLPPLRSHRDSDRTDVGPVNVRVRQERRGWREPAS